MRLDLLLSLLAACVMACRPGGGAAQNPGSPAPVAGPEPGPGTEESPRAQPGDEGPGGLPRSRTVPLRADQAPLVPLREVLEADSLLGRRVRVAGRCTASGRGRRAGSWTLEEGGVWIEVRGLVPFSCAPQGGEELTIFAQIEPKSADSRERLLLRLPD